MKLRQTQNQDWIVDKEEIKNKEEEPDSYSITEYFRGKIRILYAQSCFFKERIDKYGL